MNTTGFTLDLDGPTEDVDRLLEVIGREMSAIGREHARRHDAVTERFLLGGIGGGRLDLSHPIHRMHGTLTVRSAQ